MPMIIELTRLNREGEKLEGSLPAEILDLESDPYVNPESEVKFDLIAAFAGNELLVQGKTEAQLSLECSRCAEFFSTMVRDSSFLRAYEISEGMDVLDISEDIRESILLNLTGSYVCRSNCKGLCAQCGQNLNEGSCNCTAADGDQRWGALDGLAL